MRKYFMVSLILTFALSCKNPETYKSSENIVEAGQGNLDFFVDPAWVDQRVADAEKRLTTTEAGQLVWEAMEAHGGLANWYAKGPVSFRFNYQPLDGGTPRDTYQVVDSWSNRARHWKATDSLQQFGWDGEQAWQQLTDSKAFAYNTRFWALTPYYFVALPFVLDGEGVNLELLPQRRYKGRSHDVVKVTFDPGTGDAPDDYYILHFDAETHHLAVIRYIVSYPGYFAKGEYMPEKFMELYGRQVVDGFVFPARYQTHWLAEDELPGEHITDIKLSDLEFLPAYSEDQFSVPEGAEIQEEL